MPEDTQQQTIDLTAELETLRRTNFELKEKNKTRKAKIDELEANNATLQADYKKVTVDLPLRAMAQEVSSVPELFIEQFEKSHRLEMIDGEVTIVNAEDGKPINIPFERDALVKYLIDDKHPQSNTFKTILIASKASGAATPLTTRQTRQPAPKLNFGFR